METTGRTEKAVRPVVAKIAVIQESGCLSRRDVALTVLVPACGYGNTAGLVSRVASFADDTGLELTLGNFLDYTIWTPERFISLHPSLGFVQERTLRLISRNRWKIS